MKSASSRSPGAGISRGMWIALAATLALTATSYGIRSWREATHAASIEEAASVADSVAAVPAIGQPPTNPPPVSAPQPLAAAPAPALMATAPITIINPASGLPMTLPPGTPLPPGVTPVKPAAIVAPPPHPGPATMDTNKSPPTSMPAAAAAPAGLRPSVPGPAVDAMASRRAAPPPSLAATPNEAPPPVVSLPAPSFRLIGRYLDGAKSVAFLTHGDAVLAAKAGDTLPDGFKLKSIRPGGIIVLRLANKEQIEMMLVTP